MKDLEGSTFETYDAEGEKRGWQMLLAERMHTVDGSILVHSYFRRLYNVMNDAYQVIDAGFADILCIAMGMNSSVVLKTYPKSHDACIEMVRVEYELAGHKLDKQTASKVAAQRFAKLQQEMYPGGKQETPYQVRARNYDSKKRRRKAAAERKQA